MITKIYYYTATGNSLVIARKIAERVGDCELIPITAQSAVREAEPAARIGFVFPIFAWGPPRTVEEFITKVALADAAYVFAIASCGGTAANTLPRIRSVLRKKGAELHAGFIVRSAGYLKKGDGKASSMITTVRNLSGPLFGTEEERLPEIITAINECRAAKPEKNAFWGAALGSFFHDQAKKQFAVMDKTYTVAESCTGCGTCSRICPRMNIRIEGSTPTWRHDCDFCFACATWCPSKAISTTGDLQPTHDHHAAVTLGDLYKREVVR